MASCIAKYRITNMSGIKMAKKFGIPKRVTHSHTSQSGKKETLKFKVYSKFARFEINRHTTDFVACSSNAGNYLFGKTRFCKSGIIIKNAIDLLSFQFNVLVREQIRNQLDFNKHFLIC